MNLKINIETVIKAVLCLSVSAAVNAQTPNYQRPAPPTENAVFEIRAKYLLSPSVSFSGLGNVHYEDSFITNNNIYTGSEREINYDDGVLRQDYITQALADGDGVSEIRKSTDQDATAYFGFNDESQRDVDGNAVIFHRYRAESVDPGQTFDAGVTGATGWELAYTKYFSSKRSLALQVGFSFNGFDSSVLREIDADIYVKEYVHNLKNGTVPELPTNADGTKNPYEGDKIREDVTLGDLLYWDANNPDPAETLDSTKSADENVYVESNAQLRSSVYSFRAGPTYSLNLGKKFSFNVGAGISAIYLSGEFSALDRLKLVESDADNPSNPTSGLFSTTKASEWQVGPYVDASANYWLTNRVSLFSGVQYQGGSTYTQENDGRTADVDFSSQIYVHTGLGIRF